jgi:hypothetical protein
VVKKSLEPIIALIRVGTYPSFCSKLLGQGFILWDGGIYPRHEFDMGGYPRSTWIFLGNFFSGFENLMTLTLSVILRHLEAELSILGCLRLIRRGLSNKTASHITKCITQVLDLTYFSRSQRSKLKKITKLAYFVTI